MKYLTPGLLEPKDCLLSYPEEKRGRTEAGKDTIFPHESCFWSSYYVCTCLRRLNKLQVSSVILLRNVWRHAVGETP